MPVVILALVHLLRGRSAAKKVIMGHLANISFKFAVLENKVLLPRQLRSVVNVICLNSKLGCPGESLRSRVSIEGIRQDYVCTVPATQLCRLQCNEYSMLAHGELLACKQDLLNHTTTNPAPHRRPPDHTGVTTPAEFLSTRQHPRISKQSIRHHGSHQFSRKFPRTCASKKLASHRMERVRLSPQLPFAPRLFHRAFIRELYLWQITTFVLLPGVDDPNSSGRQYISQRTYG